jgi:hypothetical protein
MKTLLTLLLAMVVAFGATAQKRTIDVGAFTEIGFATGGTLYLTQGNENKVEVECPDDLFEKLDLTVKGEKLVIGQADSWKNWKGIDTSKLKVYVTAKSIKGVSVSGSGTLIGKNEIKTSALVLKVSGSGNMTLQANSTSVETVISGSGKIDLNTRTESLSCTISGSGRITAKGEAAATKLTISGSGSVKGEELTTKSCGVTISGSGSCYINTTEELEARISGSGIVYYSGSPDRVIANSSGSGKIKKI